MAVAIPIAALALTAAGTAMSVESNIESRDAQNKAQESELLRQQQLQKQATNVYANSLKGQDVNSANQQIGQAQTAAAQKMQALQNVPIQGAQAASASPAERVATDKTQANVKLSNQGAAAPLGYSDWQLQQWIKNINTTDQLRSIGAIAGQSASLLPMEYQNAAYTGENMRGAGQLVSSIGQIGGTIGAFGGFGTPKPGPYGNGPAPI